MNRSFESNSLELNSLESHFLQYPEKYNITKLSSNPNLTWKMIGSYPNLPWHIEAIYQLPCINEIIKSSNNDFPLNFHSYHL